MTQVTVKQLADEVKTPVERLLQQMREAGLPHTAAEENVTDSEKQSLLTHLKSSHKAKVEEPRKITLQRQSLLPAFRCLHGKAKPRKNFGGVSNKPSIKMASLGQPT